MIELNHGRGKQTSRARAEEKGIGRRSRGSGDDIKRSLLQYYVEEVGRLRWLVVDGVYPFPQLECLH